MLCEHIYAGKQPGEMRCIKCGLEYDRVSALEERVRELEILVARQSNQGGE